MASPTQLYGIIGHPLAQTMSPMLHNWGFEQAGVPGVYMAWPLPPEKLGDFFAGVRALPVRGGSITLPHKVPAMAFLDRVTDRAKHVGAVNAFYWDGDALCGENTDVTGFLAPLQGKTFRTAIVLGGGGACRAVLAGLQELGVNKIVISNRTASKADALAEDFGIKTIAWEERAQFGAELVVNTTSQGMRGDHVNATPYPKEAFTGKGLAYDVVYNPLRTRFMKEAEEAGWQSLGGLTMFVEQAREAFRLWTGGKDLPFEGAFTRVKQALGL